MSAVSIAVGATVLLGLSVLFYAVVMLLVALTGPHHPAERAEYSRKRKQQP